MGQFSFDITDSKGLFDKLRKDYDAFLKEPTSSGAAINFSVAAFHLYEWAQSELGEREIDDLKKRRSEISEDFQIIRDITNGSKHKELDYKSKLKKTSHHKGAFSSAFSRGFDISALIVEMDGGRELYFEDVAKRLFEFWAAHFLKDQ